MSILVYCFLLAVTGVYAASNEYELFTSRLQSRKHRGISVTSAVKYFTLGATFYLGNRFAYFLDQKYVSKFDQVTNDNILNSTVVEDIRKDQDEVWRVVHNLYQGQKEKLEVLDQSVESKLQSLEVTIKSLLDNITMKLASVDDMTVTSVAMNAEVKSLQDAMNLITFEIKKLGQITDGITENIPKLLASHDQKVIERLKNFSSEIRGLIVKTKK
jgi:hypothetical protein